MRILNFTKFNEALGFADPIKLVCELLYDKCIQILEDSGFEDGEIDEDIILEYDDLEEIIKSNKELFTKFPIERVEMGLSTLIGDDYDYQQTGGYSFISKDNSTSHFIESKSGLVDKAVNVKLYIDIELPEDPDPDEFYNILQESILHEVTHAYEDYKRNLSGRVSDSDQALALTTVKIMDSEAGEKSISLYNLCYDIYTSTGIESRAILGQIEPGYDLENIETSSAWDRISTLAEFNAKFYTRDIISTFSEKGADDIVNYFIDVYVDTCNEIGASPNRQILKLKNKGIKKFCEYWDHHIKTNFEKIKRKLYRKLSK